MKLGRLNQPLFLVSCLLPVLSAAAQTAAAPPAPYDDRDAALRAQPDARLLAAEAARAKRPSAKEHLEGVAGRIEEARSRVLAHDPKRVLAERSRLRRALGRDPSEAEIAAALAPRVLVPATKSAPQPEAWSKEAQAYVKERLSAVALRVENRPSIAHLSKLGFGPSHDAVEMTGEAGTVHPNVGHLVPIDSKLTSGDERDPAIELSARWALEAELGRPPTAREVDEAIAERDARIARLNADLDERREQLARDHEEEGRISTERLSAITRSHFRPGAVQPPYDAENPTFDRATRLAAEWPLIRELIHQEAAAQ